MSARRTPRIIIVGAGVAGITAAHVLREAGHSEITVLEKGSDVGGVWHWNRYPGLTCDVPSQIYQFGFAPNPDWSRVWATGDEIQRYHREVVDSLGIDSLIRLNSEVTQSYWDESTQTWTVTLADGEQLTAEFLLCATGVLHHPVIPDLPGLAEFSGPVVHTARWDDEVQTDGQRIAVIGTGSTGVQVVSALQPTARAITHFIRSPQWILWAPMGIPQFRLLSAILRRAPRTHRRLYQGLLRASGILADIVTTPSWRRRAVQNYARLSLRMQVRNKALREALTPDYEPLCKRQVVSGTYYRAIRADNASVVTDAISEVVPDGIRTEDGTHHRVDAIVLATGFHAHSYMRPMDMVGRAGITLDEVWAKGPRAYRMTAVPGFPNMFTVLGPNSPSGSISLQYSAELTARYIAQWIDRYRDGTLDTVEVTDEATDRFYDDVADAMGPTVWNTGCNSWYLTDAGTIDLWPFNRQTMTSMLSEPEPADFLVGAPDSILSNDFRDR